MTTHRLTDDDIALAGEFVLGLLDPAEHAVAQARLATDVTFAAEISTWEGHLIPLLDGVDVLPREAIWKNIQSGIGRPTGQDNRPRAIRFWQGLSIVSTAAALLLGVIVLDRAPQPPPITAAPLIAALGSPEGKAALTTSYDVASGTLTVTPVSLDTGALYPELWVIPKGGIARSLGIVRRDGPMRVTVAPELRAVIAQGATLAITPEREGGAPNEKATGPVIASGTIITV
jgi:anti-sigma-K factor RskA